MAISFGSNSISNLKLGSTQVLGVYQGSDLVWPSVFPPATNRMQPSSEGSGLATSLFDVEFVLLGNDPVVSRIRQDFRFRKSGNSVIFEVKGGILGDDNDYLLQGGGQGTLTSAYEKITEIGIIGGIDSVMLDWSVYDDYNPIPSRTTLTIQGDTSNTSATYEADDNGWRALNDGESIGFTFECSATSPGSGGSTVRTVTISVDVYVRKSRLPDTKIETFRFKSDVNSEAGQ